MFVDESGFSEQPAIRRTWARRGQTPVLRARQRTWHQVSIIGALVYRRDGQRVRVLMMVHGGATGSEEIQAFLGYLHRHVRGRVLLLWDGAGSHQSLAVRGRITSCRQWLTVCRLPPYAPELNPVEGLWAWIKGCRLANLCPETLEPVLERVGQATRQANQQKALLMAFLARTGLSL